MIATNDQIRAGSGDGLAVGRCCQWVVMRETVDAIEVERLWLCQAVYSELLEVRRLFWPAGSSWKVTTVRQLPRRGFVRLATADDMAPLELKYPGVMRLFQFKAD